MKTNSNLEKVFGAGKFAVTAEIGPPQNADPEVIRKKANLTKKYIDAFNVTDGQTAVVRMASWAACLIGKQEGLDPIVQMTCRDRNRIALQMDILGIAALGINNVLCLSGDYISFGDHTQAKAVYDIDSVVLVKMIKNLRDEKKFQNGKPVPGKEPQLFIGTVANPFAEPFEYRVVRLAKKVEAGADFIQTQCIFNLDRFSKWMEMVRERQLHKKVKILAGITPIKSVGAAKYMKTNVPGMDVPDEIIERLRKAPKEQMQKEGIKIAVETINQVKEIEGVAGIHIMAIEWEEVIPEVCEASGLYPRA